MSKTIVFDEDTNNCTPEKSYFNKGNRNDQIMRENVYIFFGKILYSKGI
jgi:hypothetical protein